MGYERTMNQEYNSRKIYAEGTFTSSEYTSKKWYPNRPYLRQQQQVRSSQIKARSVNEHEHNPFPFRE